MPPKIDARIEKLRQRVKKLEQKEDPKVEVYRIVWKKGNIEKLILEEPKEKKGKVVRIS